MDTDATKTIKLYTVGASHVVAGQTVDCSSAEVLGESAGVTYLTRSDVDAAIEELSSSVEDAGLDPSTSYSVTESSITVADVTSEAEDGAITVSAHVEAPGYSGTTLWSARSSHTAAGIDGLEPCGDAPTAWTDGDLALHLDTATLVHVGLEILGMVRS